MYPDVLMMGTNTMVGLCSEKGWNKINGKREPIKDWNHPPLDSTHQQPGRVEEGVLFWMCLFSQPRSWNSSALISLARIF